MIGFSVVIPTRNRANFLVHSIQSVLQQAHPHFEIIIVDDDSTDNTFEIVQSFHSDKIKYFKINHSERGYARNFGAAKAQYEWITFLDSDDGMYSHCLKTAEEVILQRPNVQIFHLGYEILHENKKELRQYISPEEVVYGNPYSCCGMFVKKDFFAQFRFNENKILSGLEDWELWLRISANVVITHYPVIVAYMSQHSDRSVMTVDKNKWINKVEFFVKLVRENQSIQAKYKNDIHKFYGGAYSYLSLHLSFDKKHKVESLSYLAKALRYYPKFIFKKRFWVILRNLLFIL